jgi:hypothetical protein
MGAPARPSKRRGPPRTRRAHRRRGRRCGRCGSRRPRSVRPAQERRWRPRSEERHRGAVERIDVTSYLVHAHGIDDGDQPVRPLSSSGLARPHDHVHRCAPCAGSDGADRAQRRHAEQHAEPEPDLATSGRIVDGPRSWAQVQRPGVVRQRNPPDPRRGTHAHPLARCRTVAMDRRHGDRLSLREGPFGRGLSQHAGFCPYADLRSDRNRARAVSALLPGAAT